MKNIQEMTLSEINRERLLLEVTHAKRHGFTNDQANRYSALSRKEIDLSKQNLIDNHTIKTGDWIRSGGGFHPTWKQVQDTRILYGISQVKVHQQDFGSIWIDAEGNDCTIRQVMSDKEMQDILNSANA